ncbi:MAG: phage terminase large subunit family protein, partial [Deltaproteobacteria bacterium]|nr:phage terminase large subunit family protein [Deltaproteobacteria bacterium]
RKIVLCAAPQTGKTAAVYNCTAYSADYNPGSTLVVMPDENAVKRIYKRRIKPLFDKSPGLARLKSGNPNDFSASGITLKNGATIDLAWAHSASALASLPIRDIVLDETDKYPSFVGMEADPISLAEVRTRTFKFTSKIFHVSTPTIEASFVWTALNNCREIRDYHVPCPECGLFQTLEFENIKWPEDERDPEKIEDESLAWYECPHCRAHWSDFDRDRAVRAGQWKPRERVHRPSSVGFHLPAFYSPFVSLSECAAEFLRAKADKAKLKHFSNAIEAKPWVDWSVERHEDRILALRDERPRGLVPKDVAALTAFVDVQDVGFWYEVRAWGWGPELESWQIAEGFIETWAGVEEVLFKGRYADAEGNPHVVRFKLIDSGHKTAEVYDFCRRHPGAFPSKGQRTMNRPWRTEKLDAFPDGRPIPGGLLLYHLNTTYLKDQLAGKLEISPADPGAWHLHSETTENYAAHMCAEFRDEHGVWQCPSHKRNDLWDCGVGNLAAADILRIQFWPGPGEQPPPAKPKRKKERIRKW